MQAVQRGAMLESVADASELDVKTVDGILYGWGEWRRSKDDLNGYAPKTMTGLLVAGMISFGRRTMGSLIPHGAMFCMDSRADVYKLVEGFADTLDAKHKSVMLAYYSLMPKGLYTDEQRAAKIGVSEPTAKRMRIRIRNGAKDYLQSRIFIA